MSKVVVVHIITKLELGGAQEITLYTVKNLPRGSYGAALIAGGEGILSPEARAIPDMEFHEVSELVREVSPLKVLNISRLFFLPTVRPSACNSFKASAAAQIFASSCSAFS